MATTNQNNERPKFFSCPKQTINVSPLQIVDFSCIRSKAFGLSFRKLKQSISQSGFLLNGMVTGFIVYDPSPECQINHLKTFDDSLLENLSEFRKANISMDEKIIALVDGAQRTEAVCQLIYDSFEKNDGGVNFPIDTVIPVAVPICSELYDEVDWRKFKTEIVAAAHALNELTRTNVPVSFWDSLCGFVADVNCLKNEFVDLWEFGFANNESRTLFLLNLHAGNENIFSGLTLKKRFGSAAQKGEGTKYEIDCYIVEDRAQSKAILKSYNKKALSLDHWYRESVSIMENLLKATWIYDPLLTFSKTGVLLEPYKSNIECKKLTVVDLLEEGSFNLHHPVFQRHALNNFLQHSEGDHGEVLLSRVFYASSKTVDDHGVDESVLFPRAFYEDQVWLSQLALRQVVLVLEKLQAGGILTVSENQAPLQQLKQLLVIAELTSEDESLQRKAKQLTTLHSKLVWLLYTFDFDEQLLKVAETLDKTIILPSIKIEVDKLVASTETPTHPFRQSTRQATAENREQIEKKESEKLQKQQLQRVHVKRKAKLTRRLAVYANPPSKIFTSGNLGVEQEAFLPPSSNLGILSDIKLDKVKRFFEETSQFRVMENCFLCQSLSEVVFYCS